MVLKYNPHEVYKRSTYCTVSVQYVCAFNGCAYLTRAHSKYICFVFLYCISMYYVVLNYGLLLQCMMVGCDGNLVVRAGNLPILLLACPLSARQE
jgi:hypothetical protein